MKKTMIIISMLVIVSSLLLAQNFERQGRMGQMEGRQGHHEMMRGDCLEMRSDIFDELELTDKQQTNIDEIRTENRKQMIKLDSEIKILRIDKNEAMRNNDFAEAKKLNEKISKLRLKKNNARVTEKEAIWNELTKEQQEKLQDSIKNHRLGRKEQGRMSKFHK